MDTPKPPKPNFLRRTFARNLINLQGLPLSLKMLTITGYLAILGLLFFTLLVELAGDRLPTVEYTIGNVNHTYKIPLVVMAIAGLAFILGWTYLLTGAAAAKARIFLPVLFLYAFQLALASFGSFLLLFLELLFFFAVLVIYGLTFRMRFWSDLPGLHFFGWLGAVSVLIILSIGTSPTNAKVAGALAGNFGWVLLLTFVFWVLLGFSIIDLGITTGRFFTRLARKILPFYPFSALIVCMLLIHPLVTALVLFGPDEVIFPVGFFLDFLFSILLIPGALVVWISRRWSVSTSAVFLTLSLASPVVMLSLDLAFAGHDFTELLLSMTGFFPPTLLFVGLTTYNLLTMGVAFAGKDGRILPKRARVLLYFGTLLLVVASILFLSNQRIVETGQLDQMAQTYSNGLLSAVFLGIPYVVWMVWKRREMLVGPEKDFTGPPRWSWLGRVPGQAWIALILVLACACGCVLVGIFVLLHINLTIV